MKKILLAGILILLLFVGTAAAVSVSYAQSQEIPLSTARDNANSALLTYVAQGKLGSSAALWKGASLAQTPITIYDQSGIVYSYLFDVINKDGTIVGQVNAAGNKLVGAPVVSILKSPRSFDPDQVIPKVRGLVETAYGGSQIDYVVFYMGQDQKIGIMAILTERNGLNHRMTYDMQTFKLKSDLLSYPGLIDASTPSSVFVSMSSSAATSAIKNYESKTKIVARVVPSMRRVISVNTVNITNYNTTGITAVKSVEKGGTLTNDKTALLLQAQMQDYKVTYPINVPKGKIFVSSSTPGTQLAVSRFYPV
jgi:hypothetical protein